MNLAKKITQIFALIFLIAIAASCEQRCYTVDEFNVSNASVDSNPVGDGINGTTYDPETGGQTVEWHDTELRSNGDMFLIKISGAWTPWSGGSTDISSFPLCTNCAKKDQSTPNCICHNQETIVAEEFQTCDPSTQQDNPAICSCTKNPEYGSASDYGAYHFPLNYFNKDETVKIADKQSPCKFIGGMGAYIALFGNNGVTAPKRIYHLFVDEYSKDGTLNKVCDISLDSNGDCKDSSGVDRTSYVFRSANDRIFMKDDGEGNSGNNSDTSDDVYHRTNEVVKLKIYDSFYDDNYGSYNIDILKGVGDSSDLSSAGMLEFLVRLVEDSLLGEIKKVDVLSKDENGNTVTLKTNQRVGGIIEFMYKSIVQDSGFKGFLSVMLSLYVAFYGIATLLGIAEINKKELMSRTLKIALILFFTGSSSWYFYNKIIVGFFYDSMNYVVGMFMSLSDSAFSQTMNTTAIVASQMERAVDISSATRFSYIDSTIKMLLSPGFAGKVFSLVFADFFGLIYAGLIYVTVFFFIYVMLLAASMYLVNIMKIIFVLCLGPIFISFTLFNQTNSMFKNWLAFLGARSLEIVMIFAILYNFVMLIDASFRDLLAYTACGHELKFGIFSINILKASGISDRNLATWMTSIVKIAALIFITKLILEKVADLAGSLISIGGVAGKADDGNSSAKVAGQMAGLAQGIAGLAASKGLKYGMQAGVHGGRAASGVSRALGIDKAISTIGSFTPMAPARQAARNLMIDTEINNAAKKADSQGLKGAKRDEFIRKEAFEKLDVLTRIPDKRGNSDMIYKPVTSSLVGLSHDRIAARLDQKLIHDPAKDFIKNKAKELRSQGLYGQDLKDKLHGDLKDWSKENLSFGSGMISAAISSGSNLGNIEKGIQKTIDQESKMNAAEAAQLFAKSPEEQQKYMQYLQNREFERNQRKAEAKNSLYGRVSEALDSGIDKMSRVSGIGSEERNTDLTMQKFARNIRFQEKDGGSLTKSATSLYDRTFGAKDTANRALDANNSIARQYLAQDHKEPEKIPDLKPYASLQEKKAHALMVEKANNKENAKRAFFQEKLRQSAISDLKQKVGEIKKLERKGRFSEANSAKKALLKDTQDALKMDSQNRAEFRKDGLSLFEKAARLSYVQKQFGINSEDPSKTLSKAINQEIKNGSKAILASAKSKEESAKQIQDLKLLKSGIFSTAKSDKEFDKLATATNSVVLRIASDGETKLSDFISRNQKEDSANIFKSISKEVTDPIFGGPIAEDKRAIEESNAAINQNDKDGKAVLNNLEKEADKELPFNKERQESLDSIMAAKLEAKELEEKLKTESNPDSKAALEVSLKENKNLLDQAITQDLNARFDKEVQNNAKEISALEKAAEGLDKKSGQYLKEVKEISLKIEELAITPDQISAKVAQDLKDAVSEKSQDSGSVIPGLQSSDLGIKGNIDDILLKSDGIKGSLLSGDIANSLLGAGANGSKDQYSASQAQSLEVKLNQCNTQMRLNKLNLKMKKFELDSLDPKSPQYSIKESELNAEITKLELAVGRIEKESSEVETALLSHKS